MAAATASAPATARPDHVLFTRDTQAFIYNLQTNAVQRMLDFDYASRRSTPSVAAIIDPAGRESMEKFFFGSQEVLIPVYRSIAKAARLHPTADVLVSFASFRSAAQSAHDALDTPQIRTVVIIAEGVPEHQTRELIAKAHSLGKWIIGPATVGGVKAGAFKIGNTGGTLQNIVESKLFRPGSVGFVSKSGGMSNECYNIVARNTDGLYEGIAVGGDRYPGSTLLDHLLRYEREPEVKMLACLGEVGGIDEYDIVEALEQGRIRKPLVIWVTGTCSKAFKTTVQFGHAGASAGGERETADAKNAALAAAGAIVPRSFDDYGDRIREVYDSLVANGTIRPAQEIEPPPIPMDYRAAVKQGMVRRPASIVSTISDDRGEELTYGDIPISKVFERNIGVGGVVSQLWFKRQLPAYATRFIEMALMITADHGPAVSGAHNTIVASRAGKDLVSSLASGILTIGPRFGGAIDDAARYFSKAYDEGLPPKAFVDDMKTRGVKIPGIGHLVKSIHNPDMRVKIVSEYALKHFASAEVLKYALEVEKITTQKRDNLILNVDGCIGICFVDLLRAEFPKEEADEYVELGALNGLFVLGRSIGLIGHYLDQKRMKQGLYRHPWDDIVYMSRST